MKEECKHKALICKTDGKPPVCSKCGIKYIEPPEEEASKKIISKYPEIKKVLEELCKSCSSNSNDDRIDCPSAYRQIEELIDKNYNLIIDKTNLSATPPFQKSVPKEEKKCKIHDRLFLGEKISSNHCDCGMILEGLKPAPQEDVIEDWAEKLFTILPESDLEIIKQEIKKAREEEKKKAKKRLTIILQHTVEIKEIFKELTK